MPKPPQVNPSVSQHVPRSGPDGGSASNFAGPGSVPLQARAENPGRQRQAMPAPAHCIVGVQESDVTGAHAPPPPSGVLGPVSHAKSAAHAAANEQSQWSRISNEMLTRRPRSANAPRGDSASRWGRERPHLRLRRRLAGTRGSSRP